MVMVMRIYRTLHNNSLHVRYTVFSTITNFVSEMTLGHVVTVALGQVVTLHCYSGVDLYFAFLGGIVQIVIHAPKLA